MTPQRWAQIEDLFHRAAECGPKERTALLDEACSSNPELRREVAGLLSCEASAGDHVQEAVRDSLDSFAFPRAGETVSHWAERIIASRLRCELYRRRPAALVRIPVFPYTHSGVFVHLRQIGVRRLRSGRRLGLAIP